MVSQSVPLIIVFAPIGALLSKHVAFKLTRQMTIMDEENNYNHSKFRYYSAETIKKYEDSLTELLPAEDE